MRLRFTFRARIVFGCLLVFAAVLLVRLYFVQVVEGERFVEAAQGQYVRSSHNLYDRGEIFLQDKDGRLIGGATVRAGYFLAINPMQVEDPEATYRELAKHLTLDRESFIERASLVDDPYEEIAHQITAEVAEQIPLKELPGVRLYRERWRQYPGGSLAAQTIGFEAYGSDGQELHGQYGLERHYNDLLIRAGQNVSINFFAELFSNISDAVRADEKLRGSDIVTSIEPSVQLNLERELEKLRTTYASKQTGGIIIDPMDGKIYALAIDPTFDLNGFTQADPALFHNPLVESVYEMGSIIKPLTIAIGLDTGKITANTRYYDSGVYAVDGFRISNYDGRGRGDVDMQTALNNSLNTGMAFIVDQVGTKTFGDYMRRFELGTETGIDLPNEARGLIDNLNSPRRVEYATASFGQGIALTPVATVRALSALANGGYLVTPHVVHEIRYSDGTSRPVQYPEGDQVIETQTSEEITRMLVEVVDSTLKGGVHKNERYTIAAKTGTAQIARPDARGYYDDRYLHSFFGYFPAYEPRFLVFLYTIEPTHARYASETLTEPFMNIVNYLINYYDLPPDR